MDAGERVPSHIVATYRQIAEHFGLKGPDQGRTKAKRANWPTEPQNHPADPVRVRVPAAVWEGALEARERGLSVRRERPSREGPFAASGGGAHPVHELPLTASEIPPFIKTLEGVLETLREQVERERRRAETLAADLADARERAGRAEGEVAAYRHLAEAAEIRAGVAERAAEDARGRAEAAELEREAFACMPWWRRALLRPRLSRTSDR